MRKVRGPSLLLSFLLASALGCSGIVESPSGATTEGLGGTPGPVVGLAGKCLDIRWGNTADGTPAQLYTCNGTAAQTWTYTQGRLVGPGGKCLDVRARQTANGTPLQLWSCNGTAAQAFTFTNGELVGVGGKCVTVERGNPADRTPLILWDCAGWDSQKWKWRGGAETDAGVEPPADAGTAGAMDAGTAPASDAGTGPVGTIPAANFYVSPSGSDTNPGTPAQPFQTLAKAQSALRSLIPSMASDLSVTLLPGTYPLTSGLTFDASDSGRNGHTVKWQGTCGAVVSGGLEISGWSLHDAAKNIYRAPLPSGFDARQLYVNDARAVRARTPIDSSKFSNLTSTTVNTTYPVSTYAHPERLEEVGIYDYWRMSRCPVTGVSGTTLTLAQPCGKWQTTTLHRGASWLENAYELLDQPGEFYVSPADQAVYYIPRPGESMSSAKAYAGRTEQLLTFNGASNIQVTGIEFAFTGWNATSSSNGYAEWQGGYYYASTGGSQSALPAAVEIDGSSNIQLTKNDLLHLGAGAVNVLSNSSNISLTGNRILDVSAHGIQIGNALQGAGSAAAVHDITVQDNLIQSAGVEFWDANGIFIPAAQSVTVSHNELSDFAYTAIATGWGWSANTAWTRSLLIDSNRIFNFMKTGTDGGGIYAMSDSPGSRLTNNYIHDDLDPGNGARPLNPGSGYSNGGSLYLEQGAGHFTVTGNVVTSTFRWLFAWSSDEHDNTVSGNWSDTSSWQNTTSSSLNNNIAQATVVTQGAWPAGAQAVMSSAGLTSGYLGIKSNGASCSP